QALLVTVLVRGDVFAAIYIPLLNIFLLCPFPCARLSFFICLSLFMHLSLFCLVFLSLSFLRSPLYLIFLSLAPLRPFSLAIDLSSHISSSSSFSISPPLLCSLFLCCWFCNTPYPH